MLYHQRYEKFSGRLASSRLLYAATLLLTNGYQIDIYFSTSSYSFEADTYT